MKRGGQRAAAGFGTRGRDGVGGSEVLATDLYRRWVGEEVRTTRYDPPVPWCDILLSPGPLLPTLPLLSLQPPYRRSPTTYPTARARARADENLPTPRPPQTATPPPRSLATVL